MAQIQGLPLVVHAVRGLMRSRCVDRVVVAGPQDALAACSAALDTDGSVPVALVTGAPDSVGSARCALAAAAPAPTDVVLLHDPTRPFTRPATIRAVVAAVRAGAAAAVPVETVTDTVKVVDTDGVVLGTKDRDGLRRVQSPQGFVADTLRSADLTDPLASLDVTVHTVPGHPHGRRVRTTFDITVMDALLAGDPEQAAEAARTGGTAHAEEGTRETP